VIAARYITIATAYIVIAARYIVIAAQYIVFATAYITIVTQCKENASRDIVNGLRSLVVEQEKDSQNSVRAQSVWLKL
jgi:hypothetical protein